jgi:adiponectin receptor
MAKDATFPEKPIGSEALRSPPDLTKEDSIQGYWPSIGTKDQIPPWLRDNDYIVGGHPMPTYSYLRSFRLWRCLHMETMNIWTHLLGSSAFLFAGYILYQYDLKSSDLFLSGGDKFAFGLFFTAAAVCFALSTTFHTLRSHSYNTHHFWGRLDIFGICVLALGAGTSLTYYAFYCKPVIQRVYWGVNLFSAIASAITLFDTGGGGTKMRTLRGSVFSLLALSAMIPIFHSVSLLGWHRACIEIGAHWYLMEAFSLLIGVGIFVSRVPERLSPGSFDIWGHSHQLFHTFAVLGGAFHVMGLVTGCLYRQTQTLCN